MSKLSPLAERVKAFIEREQLFAPGDTLFLAISGGIDSSVLLHILLELGYRPSLAHVNYQLRGKESDNDEEFVKNLAKKNELKFYSKKFETYSKLIELNKDNNSEQKTSLQALARSLRYDWFEELREQDTTAFFLTAHQLDDSLETFLINFLRGTGLAGLRGILPKRDFYRRPLLEVSRQEIQDYAAAHAISWREDSSNKSNDYLRNHLRNKVLAVLKELQPGLSGRAAENFRLLRSTYSIYSDSVEKNWKKISTKEEYGWLTIDRALLQQMSSDFQGTVLHHGLSPMGFNPEQQRQFLAAKTGTLIKAEKYWGLIDDKQLIFSPTPKNEILSVDLNQEKLIIEDDIQLKFKKIIRPSNLKCPPWEAFFNTQIATQKLSLRRWRPGDKFRPFGMGGKQQKLQDYFTNTRVNRLHRAHAWLLVNEEDDIIWVLGYRTSELYALQPQDQEVWQAILTFNRQGR